MLTQDSRLEQPNYTVIKPELFLHPFALGFYLGLVFVILSLYNYFRLKGELSRFRRHLSDKLEIEAETMKKIKLDQENLRRENESLRIKVNALNELPDRKLQRDLEVYARAEKKMLIQVPGFAPAWETAKAEAHTELVEEEGGRSAPRRIFSRLFGGGGSGVSRMRAPAARRRWCQAPGRRRKQRRPHGRERRAPKVRIGRFRFSDVQSRYFQTQAGEAWVFVRGAAGERSDGGPQRTSRVPREWSGRLFGFDPVCDLIADPNAAIPPAPLARDSSTRYVRERRVDNRWVSGRTAKRPKALRRCQTTPSPARCGRRGR